MPEATGTHLSIGEVLGLLLEEFPDVTISKIRFLESQGLIEPERTPSGYRKFLEGDVELLRVILREQREHFLPLRVIKDRIDSGELDPGRDGSPPAGMRTQGGATPASAEEPSRNGPPIVEQPTRTSIANHPAAGRAGRATAGLDIEPQPESDGDEHPTGDTDSAATTRLLPGVLVDRAELCAMASISPDELAQLEEYGVLNRRGAVPGDLYNDDAVAIAATGGAFMRAGVDVRHLRAYRTSAEREASLYEQLVVPLLRQRNPQARQQAGERLEQLTTLGAKLRAAMMRSTLRHLD